MGGPDVRPALSSCVPSSYPDKDSTTVYLISENLNANLTFNLGIVDTQTPIM
jgi:hypothetical protein